MTPRKHPFRIRSSCWLALTIILPNLSFSQGALPTPSVPGERLQQPDVVIEAPEPRFVAPTRRDKIGRIWAPVLINGQGPFRLVLDTGASSSAITADVANQLQLPLDQSPQILLRGVMGSEMVRTVKVDSFVVGDLFFSPAILPLLTDPLGGAEGVLGTEGFQDKRVFIDFLHDRITIGHSHYIPAPFGFVTIPLQRTPTGLLMFDATIGGEPVRAILDTGGQRTIGNLALRKALFRRRSRGEFQEIWDVTDERQRGELLASPPIKLGTIEIQGAQITFGQMHIFEHWQLMRQPCVLIGMDAIGLLDTVIIDYRRHELQVKMRRGG